MRLPLMIESFGSIRNVWDFSNPNRLTLLSGAIVLANDPYGLQALSQPTGASRPTYTIQQNGNNVASFNGSQSLLATAAADWKFLSDGTEYTAIVCGKANGALMHYFSTRVNAGNGLAIRSNNSAEAIEVELYNGSAFVILEGTDELTYPTNVFRSFILEAKPNDGTAANRSKTFYDGMASGYVNDPTATATPSASDPQYALDIGGIRPLTGTIGMIAFMNGKPFLASERLGSFLKMKWGN